MATESGRALSGKHAVITGGGRGIGAAIAAALAGQGAKLTLMGRSLGQLEERAAALRAVGGESCEVQCEAVDVADEASVVAAFASAARRLGPVAVLVNNAGQAGSAPFLRTDRALWQQMLDVNLTGTYLATRAALPDMLAAGWGRIINVASTAGEKGYPYVSAYCAAKHGVIGMTRALALEVAHKHVTVNAVCPGYTDTDIVRDAIANIREKTGRSEAEALAELAKHNPQGRLVRPEEVANAVLWLCLPGSEAITGQAISVSGGEVM
ncbi:NAD(P)-dependent dehydrogenase, short-chain alcohol dehydrogenase family [Aromatoleum tolulyticum]|uniref:NAD(P)-dependent dehydrogenase, short-chain alcohol dehydrogenase family n=1 Tax=Aromatoleum tolulyticum TaxID=34027 RepID=A0A1N6NWQ3_9RHOO|nr:SDR family NAD(P)-dependent oxidoreductase [Aromatoleum tolulyticum]SIP96511.1 NAD(P)-dependent dehydrogenase, short-chain alcohol dehydrogenase family [Aromatoleum tolulyticum]